MCILDRLVRIGRGKYVMKTSHKLLVMMKACFLIMFLTIYLSGTVLQALNLSDRDDRFAVKRVL